jgi:hypothetical protein
MNSETNTPEWGYIVGKAIRPTAQIYLERMLIVQPGRD